MSTSARDEAFFGCVLGELEVDMRRYVAPLAAALVAAAAIFAPTASARDSFSIAIGAPGFAVGYASPGYGYAYVPPPVYYAPRAYYAPPPVYYSPRVVYYGYRPWHHRRHYYYPY